MAQRLPPPGLPEEALRVAEPLEQAARIERGIRRASISKPLHSRSMSGPGTSGSSIDDILLLLCRTGRLC
jgi:hypothetical protein